MLLCAPSARAPARAVCRPSPRPARQRCSPLPCCCRLPRPPRAAAAAHCAAAAAASIPQFAPSPAALPVARWPHAHLERLALGLLGTHALLHRLGRILLRVPPEHHVDSQEQYHLRTRVRQRAALASWPRRPWLHDTDARAHRHLHPGAAAAGRSLLCRAQHHAARTPTSVPIKPTITGTGLGSSLASGAASAILQRRTVGSVEQRQHRLCSERQAPRPAVTGTIAADAARPKPRRAPLPAKGARGGYNHHLKFFSTAPARQRAACPTASTRRAWACCWRHCCFQPGGPSRTSTKACTRRRLLCPGEGWHQFCEVA